MKAPRLHTDFANIDLETQISYKNDNDAVLESLRREKEVYNRLGLFRGIISAQLTDAGIEFPYMPGGTAEEYLDTHELDLNTRLRWIKTIISVVRHVHEKRVLITDFGLRNFLLDDDLSLVMIDFGNAVVVPDDISFGGYVRYANSEKADVAGVGSLIYEVMTGKCYMVNVKLCAPFGVAQSSQRHNGVSMWFPYWPHKEELADTTGILLGDIILRCWLKDGFQTMVEVCEAVAQVVD